jgi:hypothetical protein
MKKRIVRLTESDLQRIVKRVIKEEMGGMEDSHPRYGDKNFNKMSREDILNLDKMGSSEYSEDTFEDEDEYYGTFDDKHKVRWGNEIGNFDYEDYDEDAFEDFDSYRRSKYAKDPKNRWAFNSSDEKSGRHFFKSHQERSGGLPFKVRKRR